MNKIELSKIDTRAPEKMDKHATKAQLPYYIEQLDELQNLLYASKKYSVLIVIQGMDASGKDGLTKDVFGTMNPSGVKVKSYKKPTELELSHDFLWRIHSEVPAKGEIVIFNRSHYEDIIIQRVHKWINDSTAKKRMKAINDFEELLHFHNNTIILKFYLHVSQKEQHERLAERLTIPRKMWKYNKQDMIESKHWNRYMKVYEDAFNNCNNIPWHIIPSDQNWYKNHLVATKLVETLQSLNMEYPGLKPEEDLKNEINKKTKSTIKK